MPDSNDGSRPVRVLIAKPGLDGHDRGAKVLVRALREAGIEVVYTGIRQTPAMIARAAHEGRFDVVGLSILSGAHRELFPRVVQELEAAGIGAGDVLLIAGGIIPREDLPFLRELGFKAFFVPGSDTREITAYILRELGRPSPPPCGGPQP